MTGVAHTAHIMFTPFALSQVSTAFAWQGVSRKQGYAVAPFSRRRERVFVSRLLLLLSFLGIGNTLI